MVFGLFLEKLFGQQKWGTNQIKSVSKYPRNTHDHGKLGIHEGELLIRAGMAMAFRLPFFYFWSDLAHLLICWCKCVLVLVTSYHSIQSLLLFLP